MKNSRGWMFVCLLLTLLAGTSAGVVADRTVLKDEPKPREAQSETTLRFTCLEGEMAYPSGHVEGRRERMLSHWQERFDLRDEQLEGLEQVLTSHGQSAHEFWLETRERYCEMKDSLRSGVRSVFDEQQLERFEEHQAERKRGTQQGGGGHGFFF